MAKAKKFVVSEHELRAFVEVNRLRSRYITLPDFRKKMREVIKPLSAAFAVRHG